jgi:hypothetical protein
VASLLPLHNFYSIVIRLLDAESSISEARETWMRNMAAEFCLRSIFFMLLHAVNLRYGTDGFTSPPKEVVLRIFPFVDNNQNNYLNYKISYFNCLNVPVMSQA